MYTMAGYVESDDSTQAYIDMETYGICRRKWLEAQTSNWMKTWLDQDLRQSRTI